MSHNRVNQLRELQSIIEEISRAIMWVNEKEEEELVFDWGDKNIDQYIPKKQESYSVSFALLPLPQLGGPLGHYTSILFFTQRLMKDLEEKEKELNKLKVKADGLLSNNHPASDKIEVSFFFRLPDPSVLYLMCGSVRHCQGNNMTAHVTEYDVFYIIGGTKYALKF